MSHRRKSDVLLALSLVVLTILLHTACAGVRSVEDLSTPATHRVRSGDTLAWIAEGYGVDLARLARANRLRDADRIEVGTVLVIPDGGRLTHVVKPGEGLEDVAALYRVRPEAIARDNRLRDPGWVDVGRRLVLPRDATLPPLPPPPSQLRDNGIEQARVIVLRAEEHYFAARFEGARDEAQRAASLLEGRPGVGSLRARALFVLGSALAGLGDEQAAVQTFAAVREADPRFEPPRGWLSPRLEELYRATPR